MKRILWILSLSCLLCSSHAGTLVQFRTLLGDLQVELYDADKPVTVANFLRYLDEGRYVDTFFHRFVPNFIIQGGGFWVTNRPLEEASVLSIRSYLQITNEINVGRFFSNARGTIAMAKTSNPNSATSQFFFNLTNNAASLDIPANSGGFTVFGHVVGLDAVLTSLNGFTTNRNASSNFIANAGGAFTDLPITRFTTNATGTRFVDLTNLIYVDITRHMVRVDTLRDGRRGIRWNAVPGLTNRVEYTTTMPPTWELLSSIVPTSVSGGEAIDPVTNTNRFYRVQVVY